MMMIMMIMMMIMIMMISKRKTRMVLIQWIQDQLAWI